MNRPYSLNYAPSPACGGRAFYETVVPATFREIVKFDISNIIDIISISAKIGLIFGVFERAIRD
jgi:hypothetical protein